MSKSVALLIVLFFLTASCIAVKHAMSSTDVAENTWVSKAPMREARGGLGVAVANGKIYAIGGSTEGGKWPVINDFVSTNEEYDPATDTWTFKTPMLTPRYGFGTAVHQNKIYCIGGKTDEGVTGVNEVYDPETDTWETKEPLPEASWLLQANCVNGKIYLMDGYPNRAFNEVYDPATDSWTAKASIPTGVQGYASVVVGSKICVIGGFAAAPVFWSNLNQIYDTETDSWSIGTPAPSSVIDGAGGVTTGFNAPKRIYVMGVKSYGGLGFPPCLTRVYDPEKDSWTAGADVPTNRLDFGVAVVNDTLYAIGGHCYNVLGYIAPSAVNEQYTPVGYGTVLPAIAVVSPENKTYNVTDVSLAFTLNKPAVWMGYSLDGQDNLTVTVNITLSGLANGLHNVTVYAKNTFENIGASANVAFSIEVPEPFPTIPVAVASVATVVVVGVGLLIHFRKRKRKADSHKTF
jgi:N-acetylneuraminic acid mutarotase